ncbi:TERF1-interacting nuclear factor 2 [Sarotherodon galilaeus]
MLLVMVLWVFFAKNEERLATCCKTVTNKEIKEPIWGYIVQRAKRPCVNAVIFQTQSGLFCINGRAPWVRAKIVAFERSTQSVFSPLHLSQTSLTTSMLVLTQTTESRSSTLRRTVRL